MRQAVETDETIPKKFKGASVVFIVDDDTVYCLDTKNKTLTKGDGESDLRVTTSLICATRFAPKEAYPSTSLYEGQTENQGKHGAGNETDCRSGSDQKVLAWYF